MTQLRQRVEQIQADAELLRSKNTKLEDQLLQADYAPPQKENDAEWKRQYLQKLRQKTQQMLEKVQKERAEVTELVQLYKEAQEEFGDLVSVAP